VVLSSRLLTRADTPVKSSASTRVIFTVRFSFGATEAMVMPDCCCR
jgi:hypothetical protein